MRHGADCGPIQRDRPAEVAVTRRGYGTPAGADLTVIASLHCPNGNHPAAVLRSSPNTSSPHQAFVERRCELRPHGEHRLAQSNVQDQLGSTVAFSNDAWVQACAEALAGIGG